MDLEEYYGWEKLNVMFITHLMVKWFGFSQVTIEVRERQDVESRVWYWIKIQKEERTWYVDGQRLDIIKRRLIEFLDDQKLRKDYLENKHRQFLEQNGPKV